jgi:hypothetical protein
MSRTIGLPLILVTLVVGGYLFVQQSKSNGPSAPAVTQAEQQAGTFVAGTNFQAAAQVLQGYYAENGTYAGATLEPGSGVALMRADATSFCLQAGAGTGVQHESGPNGTPQPGPC